MATWFITHRWGAQSSSGQSCSGMWSRGGQTFFRRCASAKGGEFFQTPALGRGVAIGDLDNDGWPDLLVSNSDTPMAILHNDAKSVNRANWLGIRLVGREHRDVVGSSIIVEADGKKQTRFVKGGGSYLSASDSRILFRAGRVPWHQETDSKMVLGSNPVVGESRAERLLGPARSWQVRGRSCRASCPVVLGDFACVSLIRAGNFRYGADVASLHSSLSPRPAIVALPVQRPFPGLGERGWGCPLSPRRHVLAQTR